MNRRLMLFCIALGALFVGVSVALAQQSLAKPKIRGVNGTTVGWAPVTGASAYRLRWHKPNGTKTFKTVAETQHTWNMNPLEAGETYIVQARALGDGKNYQKKGKWSDKYTFTAPSNAPSGPIEFPKPNLSRTGRLTVAWDAITGVKDYRIRWTDQNGKRKGKKVDASQTSFTFSKKQLKSGVQYDVQVRARGDGSDYELKGPWSDKVQVQH